jgi:uncharacterized protein with PIN domain
LSPFSQKESGVYKYRSFGVASLSAIREPYLRKQQSNNRYKFLVDGMLGSLAIKLRILGFDAVYNKTSSDAELLESTASSSRHLLTSDVDLFLFARRKHLRAILISSRDESGRVAELYAKLGMKRIIVPRVSRCSACNGTLGRTKAKTRLGKVMYACESCDKTYWRGAHWKKLDAFFGEVNTRLKEIPKGERERIAT